VRYEPAMPFFESFLTCFSVRFSFSDLPTFLMLCCFGDLSATVTPPVGDATIGDVEISDFPRLPKSSYDLAGALVSFGSSLSTLTNDGTVRHE
jgi:hypothetical protein